MTHPGAGTPHLANLRASNPGLKVHVAMGATGRGRAEAERIWRAGDRRILTWWRQNRGEVRARRVAFVEWDVVVNMDLRPMEACGAEMIGREMPRRGGDWVFWREVPRLDPELRAHATGLAPLAFVLIDRACLDALLLPRWDKIFAADIYCELRLPTVARAMGFSVAEHPMLMECRWWQRSHPGMRPGIWHAVKSTI